MPTFYPSQLYLIGTYGVVYKATDKVAASATTALASISDLGNW